MKKKKSKKNRFFKSTTSKENDDSKKLIIFDDEDFKLDNKNSFDHDEKDIEEYTLEEYEETSNINEKVIPEDKNGFKEEWKEIIELYKEDSQIDENYKPRHVQKNEEDNEDYAEYSDEEKNKIEESKTIEIPKIVKDKSEINQEIFKEDFDALSNDEDDSSPFVEEFSSIEEFKEKYLKKEQEEIFKQDFDALKEENPEYEDIDVDDDKRENTQEEHEEKGIEEDIEDEADEVESKKEDPEEEYEETKIDDEDSKEIFNQDFDALKEENPEYEDIDVDDDKQENTQEEHEEKEIEEDIEDDDDDEESKEEDSEEEYEEVKIDVEDSKEIFAQDFDALKEENPEYEDIDVEDDKQENIQEYDEEESKEEYDDKEPNVKEVEIIPDFKIVKEPEKTKNIDIFKEDYNALDSEDKIIKEESKLKVENKKDDFWDEDYSEEKVNETVKEKLRSEKPQKKSKEKKTVNITPPIMPIILILTSIILLIFSMILIYNSFGTKENKSVHYKETSDIKYQVLSSGKSKDDKYLSKKIQLIKINMNYNFEINEKSFLIFNNKIAGDLMIVEKDNPQNEVCVGTYVLSGEEENLINNSKTYKINKNITIDYNYYNNLAEQYKNTIDGETENYLLVYLIVKQKNQDKNKFIFDNKSEASIKIPLSKEVINLNVNDVNNEESTNGKPKLAITSASKFIIGIFLCLLAIIALLLKKLKPSQENVEDEELSYDKVVNNILEKYDYLVVKTLAKPEAKTVVRVYSFKDLMDTREKLSETIKYYEVKKHSDCYFYITHSDKVYLFKISAKDFEKKDSK